MMQAYSLNRELILERLAGDEEILLVMIDMYLQDFESYCGNLESALTAADALVLQREAHTVKGLLATFADEEGAQAAHFIEQQSKQGNLEGLSARVKLVQARMHEIAAVLTQEIA